MSAAGKRVKTLDLPVGVVSDAAIERARSVTRLSDAVVGSPVVILVVCHPTGPVLAVSENMRRFGYTPEQFLSGEARIEELCHPDDFQREVQRLMSAVSAGDESVCLRYRFRDGDGQYRHVENYVGLVRDAAGHVTHHHAMLIDVTEHHRLRAELSRSQTMLRRAQKLAGIGCWHANRRTGEIIWSDELYDMMGIPRGTEVTRQIAAKCVAEEDRARVDAELARAYEREQPFRFHNHFQRADGSVLESVTVGDFHRDDQGDIISVGVVQDVTHQHELERAAIQAVELEQHRFGRDMHDSIGQDLAGVRFMAKALAAQLNADKSEHSEQAHRIADLCGGVLKEVREVARGLITVDVGAEGLAFELETLAERTSKLYGVTCEFICDCDVEVDDAAAAKHLYHIAREAAGNAIRHGRATHIAIHLETLSTAFRLSVVDSGTWLDRAADDDSAGVGLRIMEFRSELIGGTLEVHRGSGENDPTTVICVLPRR